LQQLKTSLLANVAPEYGLDIQPWLGSEVTVALTSLDLDRDPSNGEQPGYLFALGVQDADQALEFLQSFWQRKALTGTDLIFEDYRGVKLIYGRPTGLTNPDTAGNSDNSGDTVASALLGRYFLLLANDPKVLRDAINNIQVPEFNLLHNPAYQETIATLDHDHLSVAFLNLSQLLEAAYQRQNVPSLAELADLPPYLGLGLEVGPTDQGLLVNAALAPVLKFGELQGDELQGDELQGDELQGDELQGDELQGDELQGDELQGDEDEELGTIAELAPDPNTAATNAPDLLQFIPTDVALVATSQNLNSLWHQSETTLAGYKVSHWLGDPIAKVEQLWGLDLPEDIFAWVEGNYALGFLLPDGDVAPASIKARADLDWIFIADRQSPDAAAAIAHLDQLAQDQGFDISQVALGDQSLTAWTQLITSGEPGVAVRLETQVQGVHTTVGPYEIFASSAPAIAASLAAAETSALGDNPTFQSAIVPLASQGEGYVYLNWPSSRAFLEQRFPLLQLVELGGQPLFENLQSLILRNYGEDDGVQQVAISIQFAGLEPVQEQEL
jgi:hypothetical protein